MTQEKFNVFVKNFVKQTTSVLYAKGKSYALNKYDRLEHFKRAADYLDTTPKEACLAQLTKHLISICDMVCTRKHHSDKETVEFSPEQWDEKIGDAINYLVLLRALVIDEEISNVTTD